MIAPLSPPDQRLLILDLKPEQWDLAQAPAYRRKQLTEWIYQKRADSFSEMLNLPLELRLHLESTYRLKGLTLNKDHGSGDTTKKFLFQLHHGDYIESVLIPASPALYGERSDRHTLCLSTQVGCAYGCKFCASGLDGWKRNLSPGEIYSQIMEVEKQSGKKINNLVFMGMGEPLANFDHLMAAIDVINASWGLNIGARHITISTSGIVPRIKDLADQPRQLRLAISLHGATDPVRSLIMPINKKYPVDELLAACNYFQSKKKKMITFEYILISGINDQLEQARLLVQYARKLHAKINLIPYNTVEGLAWSRPNRKTIQAFASVLKDARIPCTVRLEKGHDIDAACGQLRLKQIQPA